MNNDRNQRSEQPGGDLKGQLDRLDAAETASTRALNASAGRVSFSSINPATGASIAIHMAATTGEVDEACWAAAEAFAENARKPDLQEAKAVMLDSAANGIEALGDHLLRTTSDETGLTVPRLAVERDRTVYTLHMFAALVREGSWVRAVIDQSGPGELSRHVRGQARPDLRRMLMPLGPVAVFGASNFPLAYSTAGGDSASALAAGCPVIVKGHPLHPGTGELVAEVMRTAVKHAGLHPGTFAHLLAGGERDLPVGQELVTHPAIKAVGFTGSFRGGKALAKLAGIGGPRPEPIPVFAEMGSINPVFILPDAMEKRAEAIAEQLFKSLYNSAGQQCTAPGLILAVEGPSLYRFTTEFQRLVETSAPQPLLSSRMRSLFLSRIHEVSAPPGVTTLARSRGDIQEQTELRPDAPRNGHYEAELQTDGERQAMVVLTTNASTFQRYPALREEVFGPSTIVVTCRDIAELMSAAELMPGSLVGAIFAEQSSSQDQQPAAALAVLLTSRVGRVVYNGVTTGVEVSPAMVHGGPWPATNRPDTTAVGPIAIERWCRPVCFQNFPKELLPRELQQE